MDTLTPAERSERMSRIRSRDTKPEIWVRKALHAEGFRFRLHRGDLPGRPDIVLPKYNAVVFVHGCFWHAHHCQKQRIPATRSEFWNSKFEANVQRDTRNTKALRNAGWRVYKVWECEISTTAKRERTMATLIRKLRRGA